MVAVRTRPFCDRSISSFRTAVIPYSGLFSRGKIFTNYPNPNIQGENFHELSQSKYSRGKISRIVKRCDIIIILRACISRMETHEVESVVRGYHIYKDIWSAAVGSTLSCRQERFNPHDSYAVAEPGCSRD